MVLLSIPRPNATERFAPKHDHLSPQVPQTCTPLLTWNALDRARLHRARIHAEQGPEVERSPVSGRVIQGMKTAALADDVLGHWRNRAAATTQAENPD